MRIMAILLLGTLVLPGQDLLQPRAPAPPRTPAPPLPSPRLPRIRLPRLPGRQPAAAPAHKLYPYLGWLRAAAENRLLLDVIDGEQEEFQVTAATRFFEKDAPASRLELGEGDEMLIEARKEKDGRLLAETVVLRRRMRDVEPEPEDRAPPEPEPSAPRPPPELRRRGPAEPLTETAPASAAERFWRLAKEENLRFVEEMPDFLCRQEVKRMHARSRTDTFRPLDTVTAEVSFIGGRELYDDVRVNGKASEPALARVSGTWSFGEWATTLRMVFTQIDNPRLTRRAVVAGRAAFVYEFDVHAEDSRWQITYQTRTVYPGYHGAVWLDAKTARALRIELTSTSLPAAFAISYAEWMVSYDFVLLGDEWLLLPSRADNLGCWRHRPDCTRNMLTFSEYRRFTSESTVYTTESAIEYEKPSPPRK